MIILFTLIDANKSFTRNVSIFKPRHYLIALVAKVKQINRYVIIELPTYDLADI